MVALAVMMLVFQRKIGLDDDVFRYVPELKTPLVIARTDAAAATFQTQPATQPITIRAAADAHVWMAYAFSSRSLALYQKVTGETNPP